MKKLLFVITAVSLMAAPFAAAAYAAEKAPAESAAAGEESEGGEEGQAKASATEVNEKSVKADNEARTQTAKKGPAPERIMVDPSSVKSIKVTWDKEEEKMIYYNVFRSGPDGDYIKINREPFIENQYVDFSITTSTVYEYKVQAIDAEGNSSFSKSRQVTSVALKPPSTPLNFKVYQDIKSAQMKWAGASGGSFELSGYNVYRGKSRDNLKKVKFLKAGTTKYDDSGVTPAVKYYYRITAVDTEGNQSVSTDIKEVVPFPVPRTGLTLMPTAYRNNIYDNFGFNMDVSFAYFIGTLYGYHSDLMAAEAGVDLVDKIGVVLLTADAKGTIINEHERWPSLGIGGTFGILIQEFIGSSDTTGVSQQFTNESTINQMYGLYAVASKTVYKDIAVHGGYMYSPVTNATQTKYMSYLSDYIVSEAEAAELESRGGSAGNLQKIKDSNNAYFLGISSPLVDKMSIKVEYLVPIEGNPNALMPDYYMINTHIDRFISFNVGYFHYPGGYAWLGYIDIRFTVFPSPYK